MDSVDPEITGTVKFNLADSLALLSRTPRALDALLRGLPEVWVRSNEGENSWCAYDVVGHLVHGERADWMARMRRIVECGETREFDKFDRTAMFRESEGKSLDELLDEFARLRKKNIEEVASMNFTEEDLARRGKHPSLGTVTLAELLSTWAVHDMTHLHQIARVLAYQYREDVGPWRAYLGVLQCNGHSS